MTKEARNTRNVVVLQKLAKQGKVDKKWVEMVMKAHAKEVYKKR